MSVGEADHEPLRGRQVSQVAYGNTWLEWGSVGNEISNSRDHSIALLTDESL
jgi:hypothetical protein